MFKAWNIIGNLIAGYSFGHFLWEPKLLAQELIHRGIEPRVMGHNSMNPDDFPGARIVPTFDLILGHSISDDPTWGELENFVVHNLAYEKALGRVDRRLWSGAPALFIEVGRRHLLGALRWLAHFDDSSRPRAAILLAGDRDGAEGAQDLVMYRKVWANCAPVLKQQVKLCVRSEFSARNHEQAFGIRPHVLPSALAPAAREIDSAKRRIGPPDGPLTISFMGGARDERGAGFIPSVVEQCAPLGVRFLIQVADSIGSQNQLLTSVDSLRGRPEVVLHEGPLPRDTYSEWIARSLVLLPYVPTQYRTRSSGVYLEAKCFGSPAIVGPGGWMAEEVSRLGNGLVFEEYSAEAIARAIARAQREIGVLRARAEACAAVERRQHGTDRCVDAIEGLFHAG